jgi:peptidoglycan/xylan/chitin deacetylase (PgdA/CDA1 family)
VDDGYRDFFLHAYPVFKEYSIPAIVYLITDFLDGRLWPWWNEVSWAFENTPCASVTLGNGQTLQLGISSEQRAAAADATTEWLKTVPNQSRLEFMRRLPDLLQVILPVTPPACWEPLKWDEVRAMNANGIEFGGHTKTHPILSRLETDRELETEIRVCRQRITEELGVPPAHFAYPNGQPQDVGKRVRDMVAACGFLTAVSTTGGFNTPGQDPYYLKRLPLEPSYEYLRSFRMWTAGIGV